MAFMQCVSRLAVVPCLIIVATGCNSSTSPIPLSMVKGNVKFKGANLAKGTVTFMPVTGTNTSSGEIANGSYSMSTFTKGDGVPPGEYSVSITSWEKLPGMGEEGVPAIPKKYFDSKQSGLTAKVTEQRSQTIDFDLPAE